MLFIVYSVAHKQPLYAAVRIVVFFLYLNEDFVDLVTAA